MANLTAEQSAACSQFQAYEDGRAPGYCWICAQHKDAHVASNQQLRRYVCVLRTDSFGPSAEMKELPGGAYVLFTDVEHLLRRPDETASPHKAALQGILARAGADWESLDGNDAVEMATIALHAIHGTLLPEDFAVKTSRDDPNAAVRWICPGCTTVNAIEDEVCCIGSCKTPRPASTRRAE